MESGEFRRASHAVWEAMAPGWERQCSWFEEHARPLTERMVEAREELGRRLEPFRSADRVELGAVSPVVSASAG